MKKIILILVLFLSVLIFPQKFKNLAPTPPMGWNSWNTFQTNVNEQLIKETANALIKSGMRDAGYYYIVIDDGWEAMVRDSSGNIVPDPKKFPHGMKSLGDFLHSEGFKFGIHNFLNSGQYTMDCYQDGLNADRYGNDYKRTTLKITKNKKLEIKLAPAGGWAAIIYKK